MIGKTNTSLHENAISIIDEDIAFQNITIDHTEYIMLAKYVPHLDFYIVNTINRKMALAPILRIKNFVFALSIFISLLTIGIIFFISRKISLPLIHIIGAMSDVKEGNFDKKICIDGSYEVRVLGRTFNTMLDDLEKHINRMKKYYKDKRDQLLEKINKYDIFRNSVISGENAGLHCLIQFDTGLSDIELKKTVEQYGFKVALLRDYCMLNDNVQTHTLIFYYR